VALRFFDDMTQSEIARDLGISQMHVSRLLRAALDKLRDRVAEPDQAS
jgi:RNA polymerase sigma-B factor